MSENSDNWCGDVYVAEVPVPGGWRRPIFPFLAGVAVASLVAVLLSGAGHPNARVGTLAAAAPAPATTPAAAWDRATPPVTAAVIPAAASPTLPTPPARGPAGGAAPPARSVPVSCATPGQGVAPTPTEASFAARLVGTWLGCSQTSVFGTGEVGMLISSDGRWSKLARNATGGLIVSTGWGNEGTWDVVDTSVMNGPGVFQVNLHIDGSGTVISLPVFSAGAPRMRLNNGGVFVADYVPAPKGVVPAT